MIKEERDEEAGRHEQGNGPGRGNIVTTCLEVTGKDDEAAFGPDRRNAVERRSNPDKGGLEVLRESQHVEAVGSGIMGGRAEGHQPEEGQGILKETSGRDGRANASERGPDEKLHQKNPVTLRPEEVDQGAPERLYHPRERERAGVKG